VNWLQFETHFQDYLSYFGTLEGLPSVYKSTEDTLVENLDVDICVLVDFDWSKVWTFKSCRAAILEFAIEQCQQTEKQGLQARMRAVR
jgi:hypothetical protein